VQIAVGGAFQYLLGRVGLGPWWIAGRRAGPHRGRRRRPWPWPKAAKTAGPTARLSPGTAGVPSSSTSPSQPSPRSAPRPW